MDLVLLILACALSALLLRKLHQNHCIAINDGAATMLTIDALRQMIIDLLGIDANADDAAISAAYDACGTETPDELAAQQAANERRLQVLKALGLKDAATNEEMHTAILAVPANIKAVETQLGQERSARSRLLLDVAINEGRITAAQRGEYETAFNSDFAGAEKRLGTEKPKLNTDSSKLNGLSREKGSIATAQERQVTIITAVNERMKSTGETYEAAFLTIKKDKKFKSLFEAMKQPGEKD